MAHVLLRTADPQRQQKGEIERGLLANRLELHLLQPVVSVERDGGGKEGPLDQIGWQQLHGDLLKRRLGDARSERRWQRTPRESRAGCACRDRRRKAIDGFYDTCGTLPHFNSSSKTLMFSFHTKTSTLVDLFWREKIACDSDNTIPCTVTCVSSLGSSDDRMASSVKRWESVLDPFAGIERIALAITDNDAFESSVGRKHVRALEFTQN